MQDHGYAAAAALETVLPSSKKRKRELKLQRDRSIQKRRINIGLAFPRWKELKKEKGFQRDAEVACFLLDK